ncbi:MAG: helicase, partial [Ignavibacteria bacterium]|nr:helicase [Ignavibacteria bacterium]
CNADSSLYELTFLESAKQFEALYIEKSIPLHSIHHQQVKTAIEDFAIKVEEQKARHLKVDLSKGPNEKKAISFLDAFENLNITNQQEKQKILLAKKAIRVGKFQNLHRDINKLENSQKHSPVKPVVLLEKLIQILSKFKLEQVSDDKLEEMQHEFNFNELNPEIIISESFSV